MNGEAALRTAIDLIYGDRHDSYGDAISDFTATAEIWTALLRRKGYLKDGAQLDAHSVAIMMIALKLSREAHMHKDDNCVDIAGYTGLAMDVAK